MPGPRKFPTQTRGWRAGCQGGSVPASCGWFRNIGPQDSRGTWSPSWSLTAFLQVMPAEANLCPQHCPRAQPQELRPASFSPGPWFQSSPRPVRTEDLVPTGQLEAKPTQAFRMNAVCSRTGREPPFHHSFDVVASTASIFKFPPEQCVMKLPHDFSQPTITCCWWDRSVSPTSQ